MGGPTYIISATPEGVAEVALTTAYAVVGATKVAPTVCLNRREAVETARREGGQVVQLQPGDRLEYGEGFWRVIPA